MVCGGSNHKTVHDYGVGGGGISIFFMEPHIVKVTKK